MTPKDWTLLVIASAQGQPVSPVQLQKTMFLIGQALTPGQRRAPTFYDFRAYDYGPFARAIYDDAEELEVEGLVLIHPDRHSSSRRYMALPAGIQASNTLRQDLSPPVATYLDEVVAWARRLSFNELVGAIYRQYPEMKVNSVFRG